MAVGFIGDPRHIGAWPYASITSNVEGLRPQACRVHDRAGMLARDRVTLRNLLIAMIAGTGAAFVVGTTCLGRDLMGTEPGDTTVFPGSVRSSAGGIPVGTTRITSAAAPSATMTTAAEGDTSSDERPDAEATP
jgi:hypothetical protein